MVMKWHKRVKQLKIPVIESEFSLERTLADPVKIREWEMAGLPADQLSKDNGIMMFNCHRWPLIIDPQNQANKWLKEYLTNSNLQILKLTQNNYQRYLENAIKFGLPTLLENIEEKLDPFLEPILLKAPVKRGAQWLLKLGESEIQYSFDFKFFMTTKLGNPHYLPEITIKVTLINFTVTESGLEQQLLIEVVKHEKAELEEERSNLIVQISEDNKTLQELEDRILKQISEVEGNILDDEEIINTLDASKITAETINERMVKAKTTRRKIQRTLNLYLPIAKRGRDIYFVIADLALIDPMY